MSIRSSKPEAYISFHELLAGPAPQDHEFRFPGQAYEDDDRKLVGRDHESSVLARFVHCLKDCGQSLFLQGDEGVGKTALLEEARAHAEKNGYFSVRTYGLQSESQLPLAGLQRLAESIPHPENSFDALQLYAGRTALYTAATHMLRILVEAASNSPLLVVVDDIHWMDEESIDALVFCARRLQRNPVGLLLAGRVTSATRELADDLPTTVVSPLAEAPAARLLSRHQPALARPLFRRVLAEARGLPGALEGIPAGLRQHGSLASTVLAPRLPLGNSLADVLLVRLRDLPRESSRLLLHIAAQWPPPRTIDMIRMAEHLGLSLDHLAAAEDAEVIKVDGSTIQFGHPLLATAIYWSAPFADRRIAHTAISEVLTDPWERARHLGVAGLEPDEKIAADVERGAMAGFARGEILDIPGLLQRSAQLSPTAPRRTRRLIRAAEMAHTAGEKELAGELLQQSFGVQTDAATEAARTALIGLVAYGEEATPAHAWPAAIDALRIAEEHSADYPLSLWSLAGVLYGAFDDRKSAARINALLGGRDSDLDLSRNDDALLALLAAWTGRAADVPTIRRAVRERARTLDVPAHRSLSDAALALAAVAIDEPEAACALGTDLVPKLLAFGFNDAALALLSGLMFARLQSADATAVEALARQGLGLATACSDQSFALLFEVGLAHLAAWRGDSTQVRALTDPALAFAVPRRQRMLAACAHWARGLASLGDGKPEEAFAELRPLIIGKGTAAHRIVSDWAVGDIVSAAEATHRIDEVRPYLDYVDHIRKLRGSRLVHHLAARSWGVVDGGVAAERHFQTALSVHIPDHAPFERARTELVYGEWLRRQRRVLEARPHLLAALEAFQNIGATVWEERAKSELGAAGHQAATPAPADGWRLRFDLTPREAEVTNFAARGLSNQQIGWQLGLTPRTVASHLARAFPKLGITNRRELASLMEAVAPVKVRQMTEA
ncbi:AAA family ATPase [Streptomyces sp. NPDC090080]|uniref:AAA family ATPase n=1 Tax=Streptomyces sp. NPDC090080 TaxID=3365939 RepID=UPI00381489CF